MKDKLLINRKPWVLLFRRSDFYTTAMYIERALTKEFNVIPVYLDKTNLMHLLPRTLSAKIFTKWLNAKVGDRIKFDLVLVIDPVMKIPDLNFINAPKVYYAIDSHVAFNKHLKTAHIQNYDFVFVAQKKYIHDYKIHGCKNIYWLPLACDPEFHTQYDLPLKYDLCFIGNFLPNSSRDILLKKLQNKFKMFIGYRYLHDLAEIYSQSKIIFNKSIKQEINMRVFEAMSCGHLLLTDKADKENGLEELFINKKHLVIYENENDLIEKAFYYLNHVQERTVIALEGQKEVHKKHTYNDRIKYLFSKIYQHKNYEK